MKSNSTSSISLPIRDRRGPESACGHVERNLPAVVQPGRQRQPDLPYDLGPELQRHRGVAPRGIGQFGPNGCAIVHGLPGQLGGGLGSGLPLPLNNK